MRQGRFAVVLNDRSPDTFVFWQAFLGNPYLFDTRADAERVFREQCQTDNYKATKFWVVEMNNESALIYKPFGKLD